MAFSVKYTGDKELDRKLEELANAGLRINRAAVSAAIKEFARAARNASPGSVKKEIGLSIRIRGGQVTGRAGLLKFPIRGVKGGPHGVYLERGTKHISARRFINNALKAATPVAEAALEAAVERKISQIASVQK